MRDLAAITRGALIAVGVTLLMSGCGTGADRDSVRSTSTRFVSAFTARSGAEACAQLSPALRTQVRQDEQTKSCADAVLKVNLQAQPIRRVRVFATSAIVDLGGESMFLGLTPHGWRIDALGCRLGGAKKPYDCQEQA